jgi:protein-tyrosine kinase
MDLFSAFKRKNDIDLSATPAPEVSLPYVARYEKSVVSEAFKILRTNLQFTIKLNEPRIIVVTSPSQGEGKTTIASNLGVTFAATKFKTLLVDADMRIPNLHLQFSLSNADGLSNCLNGDCKLDECIQTTQVENLSLLPSGPIPPNSSELLTSQAMLEMAEELKKRYQLIIVDSPPVNIVADTPIISSLADGVLIVVSAGSTRRKDLSKALDALEYANIIGFIMNVTKRGTENYYYRPYYNRYYNRYYTRQEA